MNLYNLTHDLILCLLKGKTLGGKYLKRWQVTNPKTGKMKWVYKYKPISQRGAHEVTKDKFQKVTKLSGEDHKGLVEKALQDRNRVSLHILRDYPDLVQKYGESGTVDTLQGSLGVKVKMQNGSDVDKASLDQIQKHLSEVYSAFGDRSEMSRKFGLKISHSGQKLMHARKALGIFFPSFKAIGVSFNDKEGHPGMTLAHEFGHFMDYYIGGQKGFASERHGSIENQIAKTFRDGIGMEYQDKGYWARTCECFARAMECYYNHKTGQPHDERNGVNPDEKHYLEKVKPLIDQFFKEKDSLLKAFMRTV